MFRNWRAVALSALLAFFVLVPYRTTKPHSASDLVTSYGHIVQARMALEEGQLPVRIAPWEWNGSRYPVFQFYSPLLYTTLGAVDLLFRNPWWTIRICVWLALFASGLAVYRLARDLVDRDEVALACIALYMCAPYLAINIQARGALAEIFGQCLLPFCALWFWRLWQGFSWPRVLCFGVVVSALIQTHLITAFYFLCFSGLWLALTCLSRREFRPLLNYAAGCVLSVALAAWFLVPVGTLTGTVFASTQLANPYDWNWLTPIHTLLSPVSMPPTRPPAGSDGLHPAFGWLSLASFVLLAMRARREPKPGFIALLSLAILLGILIWSPVNFWKYLPRILHLEQFPYRNLAQWHWLAVFAFAWGLEPHRRYLDSIGYRFPIAILLTAALLDCTYLIRRKDPADISHLDKDPTLGYGRMMYLPRDLLVPTEFLHDAPLNFAHPDGLFRLAAPLEVHLPSLREQPGTMLRLEGELEPSFPLPSRLSVLVGKQTVDSYTITSRHFVWLFPMIKCASAAEPGTATVAFRFGLEHSYRVPGDYRPRGLRSIATTIVQPLAVAVRPRLGEDCHRVGDTIRCNVSLPTQSWVQLPVLHYPGLSKITVDGSPASFVGSPDVTDFYTTPKSAVRLDPGTHVVEATCQGSVPGNWMSVLALLGVLLGAGALTARVAKAVPSARQARHTSP
ncbi:MAG TPA: 6-pyruvoyl-tetrahydropterin synthase-related protein [Bryobacteraceae bacterium]|nr:6-pyruvoyl-tetrahydropterin synthase-related protein [Bryobacteraceae bacterium]